MSDSAHSSIPASLNTDEPPRGTAPGAPSAPPGVPDSPEAEEYRSDWNADEDETAGRNKGNQDTGKPGQAPGEKTSQAWPG